MQSKPEVSKMTGWAIRSFHEYASSRSQRARRVLKSFCRERPCETRVLVAAFDAAHPGLNHVPARKLTRTVTKVRSVVRDLGEPKGDSPQQGNWVRKHRLLVALTVALLFVPAVLSPTHPFAVYGYLAELYTPSVTPEVYAATGTGLRAFLTSPSQVRRYRADLLEDMLDRRSGKLFAIVRDPDDLLHQESIRTWNGFLPARLPRSLWRWLDRKEFPYLGDEVDIWLQGKEIIAMGHYHAFGGPPSPGDRCAQRLTHTPEVVVVNGVVPMVYVQGAVVPFGHVAGVSDDVFRSMRPVEMSLTMDGARQFSFSTAPSEALRSFLGYLNEHRNVDIAREVDVARTTYELCAEFKSYYMPVFPKGYILGPYVNDPDLFCFVENLGRLKLRAESRAWTPEDHYGGLVLR